MLSALPGFAINLPRGVLFGRGQAAGAAARIMAFGARGLLVHGADFGRADWLAEALGDVELMRWPCRGEPTLADLQEALGHARAFGPLWVAALGGGAAIDMGKALAALIPAPGDPMDHFEVVGRGLPLAADPLPFVALPTTAGTGAEATMNAVIGLPEHGRKVSLRDPRMLPRLAIVDPALTDGCPPAVTLASGLDAIAQVIEPFVSRRANPFTDALCRPAIGAGLRALRRLTETEDVAARDTMAWVSLSGGMALANGGLGGVHGLAGVIGGVSPAAHGAICGALLGPVLAANAALAGGETARRLGWVRTEIAAALDLGDGTLGGWTRTRGLPGLVAQGVSPDWHRRIAETSLSSSSMKGNPVELSVDTLTAILAEAG